MKTFRIILVIGFIEIMIGGVTLLGTLGSVLLGSNTKPLKVLIFVITAATTSTLLGIGILKFKKTAYRLLCYFSSVVLLSKILILLDVIRLSGALETVIPNPVKDWTSIIYHSFVLATLLKPDIKKIFHI